MKDKLKKLKDKSLVIYLIINLIYILIGSYIVYNGYVEYEKFSYVYIALLGINILIILLLFFKKKYIKNKIDIFLILIIIFAIISTIFAYNQNKALFGAWGRYEGLFAICYYMTIIFLTSFLKKEDRKIMIYAILLFGLIQCLYSYCQRLGLFNVKTKIVYGYRWAVGFTGNRNFFGTIMVICIGYSMGLYMESNNKLKTVMYLILTFLFSIGILFSKTRSCLVSLIFMIIILLIYAIKMKYIKKYIILVLTIGFSILLLQLLNFEPLSRFSNTIDTGATSVEKVSNGFSSNRIDLWKETLKVTPKYLIHGVGIDNFANIIDGKPIRNQDGFYDKAHNEYLQILVTMGLFSLISYLCLHFIIIKDGIKNCFKNKEIYLLLPIIGYIVQAQFNISIIEVAPLFYIGLGLLVDRKEKV